MKRFYEKSEMWFAVIWIMIYVAVMGNLRNNFGGGSPIPLIGLLIIAIALTAFIRKNKLQEKYVGHWGRFWLTACHRGIIQKA